MDRRKVDSTEGSEIKVEKKTIYRNKLERKEKVDIKRSY